jgi:MFS family permease
MSLLIVGSTTTIVNVALPSIHRSLHASISGLQWVIDAYTLVLASLLMLAGSTADRVGRRRTFQTGLVVFSLGSLLCALARSVAVAVLGVVTTTPWATATARRPARLFGEPATSGAGG